MAKAKRKSGKSRRVRKTSSRKSAKALHDVRFPNESAAYRSARNQLLKAEIDLRRETERVAALRRKLPAGGVVPVDYAFEELGIGGMSQRVHMSQLFGDKDTLVLYSYMYGPSMEHPCPSCTSILDGLDGSTVHITQRVNFAVVAKSPIARIHEFARTRGWTGLRLLSSAGTAYNQDYHGENTKGSQIPALNVFVRHNGKIHHIYCTELMFAPTDKGQNPRHVDSIWPLWNMFDFTPDGRGTHWQPKLRYG